MEKFRIGVDLDGVCYDFVESLRHYLVTKEGFDPYDLGESTTWEFFRENWGMSLEDFLMYFADGVNAGVVFLHGEAEIGARDNIEKLRDDGHEIHIITHRSVGTKSVQNTGEWLQREGIEHDTLTFARDKTVIYTDIFLEDNVDNFLELEKNGSRPFIFDRPWNQHLETDWRVKSWDDFYSNVTSMAS